MRNPRSSSWFVAIAGLVLVVGLVSACSDDGEEPTDGTTSEPAAASGGTVEVTLQEFAVSATPASVSAGSVTFEVTNEGPDDVHEFVVIQTELAVTDLPTDEDGAVLEDGDGMTVVDEIEDLEVGASESLTVDLDAGPYALICNIVEKEDGEPEAHYSEGMRTAFEVT
jgi:uncharacterized cupredoxin-like copper-binding protein